MVRGTIPQLTPSNATVRIDVWKHAQDDHGKDTPCAAR
jgi:hypothetical protein